MDTNNLIRALRQQQGLTQQQLADRAGLVRPVISRAEKSRRGLSVEAAEQLGDVLDVDPLSLFISSQVAAKAAQVDAGEISASNALASLSRVITTVGKMHKVGELTASPKLTEAIELLGAAITELSSETGAAVKSFATIERYDEPGHDGRSLLGVRVQKSAPTFSNEDTYPLWAGHRTIPTTAEAMEEQEGEFYDDLEGEGRDAHGRRLFPLRPLEED